MSFELLWLPLGSELGPIGPVSNVIFQVVCRTDKMLFFILGLETLLAKGGYAAM